MIRTIRCGTGAALRGCMDSNLVRIQSVGWIAGKPARDLAVGDQIVWNFGHVYQVVKMTTSANGKWVFIDEANVVTAFAAHRHQRDALGQRHPQARGRGVSPRSSAL